MDQKRDIEWLESQLKLCRETLFDAVRSENHIVKELNARILDLERQLEGKQRTIDYYEGSYYAYKDAAEERLRLLEEQTRWTEKYRKESILRPYRSLKHLLFKQEAPTVEEAVQKASEAQEEEGLENPVQTEEDTVWTGLYTEEEKARFAWCREHKDMLTYQPKISIVVPVYNTDLILLDEMIASVQGQIYENWELCIANGSPFNEELTEKLQTYAAEDSRIKVKALEHNTGISGNTNEAMDLVTGEFTAMFDHDDLITENALFEVALCLNEDPELDFIYSDQDMIDELSIERFNPTFKPQWSPELLYSGNYITHFSVLRTSLIREIGGWDSSTDGAQDWDIFLRASEHTDKIRGIQRILYHWRVSATSTAFSIDTKSYALDAQIRSLRNHFERMGYPACVDFEDRSKYIIKVRMDYLKEHNVSLILWDTGHVQDLGLLSRMLKSSAGCWLKEVLVFSPDEKRLETVPEEFMKACVTVGGYAHAYNQGAEMSTADICICCTDEVLPIKEDAFYELASWAAHPELACVSPQFVNDKEIIRSMGYAWNQKGCSSFYEGVYAGEGTYMGGSLWYRNVNTVSYKCFAIERRKYLENKGFDERWGQESMAEFCLRMRKNYRHLVNPFACVQINTEMEKYEGKRRLKLMADYEMPKEDIYDNPSYEQYKDLFIRKG